MYHLIDNLISILEDEYAVHLNLCTTAHVMNRALRENRVEDVERMTVQYDTAIGRVEELEEKRLAVCDRLGTEIGSNRPHITLDYLCTLIEPVERKRLEEVRNRLKAKIRELSHVNTSNRILLEENVTTIRHTFDMISKSAALHAGYERRGVAATQAPKPSLFNRMA